METVKGILLSKNKFQERHLIGKVLLTSGEQMDVVFYGGSGGGKKQKPSTLELGNFLEIRLKAGSKTASDLFTASSWKVLWFYETLRGNFQAYYLLCFYLELCQKLSVGIDKQNFKKYGLEEDNGLFNVLSNALFYLEKSLVDSNFDKKQHLGLFLTKTLFTQGVAPDITECLFCESPLSKSSSVYLNNDKGGFACESCVPIEFKNLEVSDLALLNVVKSIWPLKYAQYDQVGPMGNETLQGLYKYFCYQFQFEPHRFKTASYVF